MNTLLEEASTLLEEASTLLEEASTHLEEASTHQELRKLASTPNRSSTLLEEGVSTLLELAHLRHSLKLDHRRQD